MAMDGPVPCDKRRQDQRDVAGPENEEYRRWSRIWRASSGSRSANNCPVRMMGDPVAGDVEATADPDPGVSLDVVEETAQRRRPPRPADEAHVEAHRHHRRVLGPL